MKTSYPPISRVCLFLGLFLVLFGQVAEAQVGWSDEPVFPMTPSIMSAGRWYITGGARWRQIQRVSVDKTGTSGGYNVPFGPGLPGFFGPGGNTPGYPQNPTGTLTDSPQTSGIWIYNDGYLNPTNPNQNGTFNSSHPTYNDPVFTSFTDAAGTSTTVEVNPGDQAYNFLQSPLMGSFSWPYGNPSPPPTTLYSLFNQGFFFVANSSQFGVYTPPNGWAAPNDIPNPTPPPATRSNTFKGSEFVKYDLNLVDPSRKYQPPTQYPLVPQVADDGFGPQAFDNWLWTPYLEIGLQTESMFDIFYSFSAFSFGNSFGKTVPAWIYPVAYSFVDYYSFKSNDTGTTTDNFSSIGVGSGITPTSGTSATNTGGTITSTGGVTTITGGTATNTNSIITNTSGIIAPANVFTGGSNAIVNNAPSISQTIATGGTTTTTGTGFTTNITGGITIITAGLPPPSYQLNPNKVWRQFYTDPYLPDTGTSPTTLATPELVTENISFDLKSTIFENRLAGRAKSSLGPYFGFTPELGVSLGGVFTLLYYRIETKTTINELSNPSNVLYAWTGGQSDKQWSFGGFAGVDLRMNLPNTFFGCSFDYSYMTDIRYSLQDIQCFINPGGRSLNFFWGLKF